MLRLAGMVLVRNAIDEVDRMFSGALLISWGARRLADNGRESAIVMSQQERMRSVLRGVVQGGGSYGFVKRST